MKVGATSGGAALQSGGRGVVADVNEASDGAARQGSDTADAGAQAESPKGGRLKDETAPKPIEVKVAVKGGTDAMDGSRDMEVELTIKMMPRASMKEVTVVVKLKGDVESREGCCDAEEGVGDEGGHGRNFAHALAVHSAADLSNDRSLAASAAAADSS